jgi:hypothetical protein
MNREEIIASESKTATNMEAVSAYARSVLDAIQKIDSTIMEEMIIYNFPSSEKMSVASFSERKHKILLVFLRHFNCAFCKATICKVASYYKTLLQLNTIPVFVHQESEECANEYFSNLGAFEPYQPLVRNMLRVSDPEGNLFYRKFNLEKASIFNSKIPLVRVMMILMVLLAKFRFSNLMFTREERADSYQMPGLFLIENKKIQNIYNYKTIADNPQLLELIVDPVGKGLCNDSFCDLTGTVTQFVPKAQKEIGTVKKAPDIPENAKESNTVGESNEASLTLLPKMVDPYSRISKNLLPKRSDFLGKTERIGSIPDDMKMNITLEQVLKNKKTFKLFKLFCASEYAVENILFYEAVEMFKNNSLIQALDSRDLASKIIKTFFEKDSPNELNTSSLLINKCIDDFKENGPKENIFDKILNTILAEQLSDTFIRFKQTDNFDIVAHIIISQS